MEDMLKTIIELQQFTLELKIELAKLREKCDNYEERLVRLENSTAGSGIYLEGVQETYRKVIEGELGK